MPRGNWERQKKRDRVIRFAKTHGAAITALGVAAVSDNIVTQKASVLGAAKEIIWPSGDDDGQDGPNAGTPIGSESEGGDPGVSEFFAGNQFLCSTVLIVALHYMFKESTKRSRNADSNIQHA